MTAVVAVLVASTAIATVVAVLLGLELRRIRAGSGEPDRQVAARAGLGPVELDRTGSIPTLVAALDALSLAVVVADADEELSFQNRSAEAIMSAHDNRSLIAQAVRAMLVEAVRGESDERELELFGPPSRSYLIRAVPLLADSAGGSTPRSTGGVAIIEDVTERRRVDHVRRDFVSNIGHELKTPVGAVGLLAETLRDETDLDTIHRFSDRIAGEVTRLTRTIDDLLALSRIEFADDLFKDPVVIGAVLDDVVGLYRNAAQARGMELVVTGERDLVVRVDRRQISSAVGNLVDNAVKYSSDGATITIGLSVEPAPDGDELVISVIDQGIGIPSTDLDRVFERFYRVDQARSRTTGGTGLGLAIVRHVAHNHGGSVAVRSREGQGSVFTLRVPVGAGDHRGEEVA